MVGVSTCTKVCVPVCWCHLVQRLTHISCVPDQQSQLLSVIITVITIELSTCVIVQLVTQSIYWFTVILDAYKWLVCKLLVDSTERLQSQLKAGNDNFTARNNSQVYYCRTLAIAYIEVRAYL